MIKCAKCGIENEDASSYCKTCGNSLTIQKSAPGTVENVSTGLAPNVAGMLCYVAGWITGIVFLLIEKEDKSVRFHAWQSILTFGILCAVQVLLSVFYRMPFMFMQGAFLSVYSVISWINWIIWIFSIVLWIVLMIKTYQGDLFSVPVTGNIAHNFAYNGQASQNTQHRPVSTVSEPPQQKAQQKSAATATDRSGTVKPDAVKFCIICGKEIPSRAAYCSKCGEKQ